jgi:putative transposase
MLVAVPPAFTSQQCSSCGHTAAENRKTQAVFECVACGHREHADRNAAKNILRRGEEMLSGGHPASTAGYAGTNACEGAAPPRRRPRSAARGGSVGISWPAEPPLAGTSSELSLSGNLHP